MNKTAFRILILFSLLNLTKIKAQSDTITVGRLSYFYAIKNHLADQWPEFNSSKYIVDLAYFTERNTYVVGRPIANTLKKSVIKSYKAGNITIEKTDRLDTIPFHMETAYEDQDLSKLWYKYPVMLCSDLETTQRYVDEIPNLQTWSTLVLHEYFHGFQFLHPVFIRFGNDSITVSVRKLQSYYDQYKWFKESIDQENQLLLKCLTIRDRLEMKKLFKTYTELRKQRLKHFKQVEKFDLTSQEEFLEKMEGSARYMEYQLCLKLKELPVDQQLANIDKEYDPASFKNFVLEDKPWMYESNSIRYFYSTGFNMLRLLDKLNVEYKNDFFDNNNFTPYRQLVKKLAE